MDQGWNRIQQLLRPSKGNYSTYIVERFGDPNSLDSKAVHEILKKTALECKNQGIELGVVLFPDTGSHLASTYLFDSLHDQVIEVLREEGVPSLDLRRELSKHAADKKLWVNRFEGHPNALANRVASEQILQRFSANWNPKATKDK